MKRDHRPWVIAHRGARQEAPENSLTALKQALKFPIDGVEFDVQMSADGLAVLYHDRTLQKVGGGRKLVSDATRADLDRIDWGKWFHSRFTGEPLPTLDQALALLDRCSHMCIEIKTNPSDQASGHARKLTQCVMDRINRPDIRPHRHRILILAFDPMVLAQVHQSNTDLRLVHNIEDETPTNATGSTRHLWGVDVPVGKLSPRSARWARQRGLHLFTYTCNGPRQLKKAIAVGVDGIITDRPGWVLQQLER